MKTIGASPRIQIAVVTVLVLLATNVLYNTTSTSPTRAAHQIPTHTTENLSSHNSENNRDDSLPQHKNTHNCNDLSGYRLKLAKYYSFFLMSQNAPNQVEEITLISIMREAGEVARGNVTFLQIGAHVGDTWNDDLFSFANEYSWCGTLLEPVPELYKVLKQNYKVWHDDYGCLKFLNVAIGKRDGKSTFYAPKRKNLASDAKVTENWWTQMGSLEMSRQKRKELDFRKIEVKTMTYKSMISTRKLRDIDFMIIDMEGSDYKYALKYIDFSYENPLVVSWEHQYLTEDERNVINRMFRLHGYVTLYVEDNTFAVRVCF